MTALGKFTPTHCIPACLLTRSSSLHHFASDCLLMTQWLQHSMGIRYCRIVKFPISHSNLCLLLHIQVCRKKSPLTRLAHVRIIPKINHHRTAKMLATTFVVCQMKRESFILRMFLLNWCDRILPSE